MLTSLSRLRTVATVSSGILPDSVPRSGLASTAITRSPAQAGQCGAEGDGRRGLADAALERDHRDPVATGDRHGRAGDQFLAAAVLRGLAWVNRMRGEGVDRAAPAGLRSRPPLPQERLRGQLLHGRRLPPGRIRRVARPTPAASGPRRTVATADSARPSPTAGSADTAGGTSTAGTDRALSAGRTAGTTDTADTAAETGRGTTGVVGLTAAGTARTTTAAGVAGTGATSVNAQPRAGDALGSRSRRCRAVGTIGHAGRSGSRTAEPISADRDARTRRARARSSRVLCTEGLAVRRIRRPRSTGRVGRPVRVGRQRAACGPRLLVIGWCRSIGAVGRPIRVGRRHAACGRRPLVVRPRRRQRQAEPARAWFGRWRLHGLAPGRRRPLPGRVVRLSHASFLPKPRTARANGRQDAGGAVTVTALLARLRR